MNVEFRLPELGENITSGDVVKVLVREGDVISGNDGVIELETEKAVVEIPCPYAGKVVELHVAKGQTVKVGQTVLSIDAEEPEEPQAKQKPEAVGAAKKSPRPSPLPKGEGTGISDPFPQKGAGTGVSDSLPKKKEGTERAAETSVPAGPEARRLARELGVDLAEIRGSGKSGRITADDVRDAVGEGPHPSPLPRGAGTGVSGPLPKREGTGHIGPLLMQEAAEAVVPPGEPGKDAYGGVRRERMPKIRRTIAVQMVKSATTIPHVTNFDDADVTDLERMRKSIPAAYLAPNVKLTALPFAMRAVALALRQHPVVNASIDDAKEEVVYKQYVNIGVAVDTPRGLVVPVVRNADRLSVPQIAEQLTSLAARARAAEFTMEELRGGTFTVSNLGAFGGTYSTPIINHPEVAILLLGRSRPVLRMHEGKVEERLMLPLSLSYDHRIVDGAAAARFLHDVIDYLQAPATLLL